MKHTLTLRHAHAQELEMRRTNKFGSGGGIYTKTRDDQLREAAEIYLRSGNLQRHCDLMAELKEWDRALALAPGVSMSYWKELCDKRVSNLKADQTDAVVPYAVAAGDVSTLVSHFKNLGLLQVNNSPNSSLFQSYDVMTVFFFIRMHSRSPSQGWKVAFTRLKLKPLHTLSSRTRNTKRTSSETPPNQNQLQNRDT